MSFDVPPEFRDVLVSVWPEDGADWFDSLPQLLEQCREEWRLEFAGLLGELSISYVAAVLVGGDRRPAVLKICRELSGELEALQCFDPQIVLQPLEVNRELGAILLQRLVPGCTLTGLHRENDALAAETAAPLIRGLPAAVPAQASFPRVADWVREGLLEQRDRVIKAGLCPALLLDCALEAAARLELPEDRQLLLHGDLHHDNFLFDAELGWRIIDPKGVIGDPVFNAARFLWNPLEVLKAQAVPAELLERRVGIISDVLEVDPGRTAGWAAVDAMTYACWTNDTASRRHTLRAAELLLNLHRS